VSTGNAGRRGDGAYPASVFGASRTCGCREPLRGRGNVPTGGVFRVAWAGPKPRHLCGDSRAVGPRCPQRRHLFAGWFTGMLSASCARFCSAIANTFRRSASVFGAASRRRARPRQTGANAIVFFDETGRAAHRLERADSSTARPAPLRLLGRRGQGDVAANEYAVLHVLRILSSYKIGSEKLWLITEAGRSSTCVLTPNEY
jgi:hypothetical protein